MRKLTIGIAAAASAVAAPAFAQTNDTTMDVELVVSNNCTVTANKMTFPGTTQVGAANIDTTSTISLTCTDGAGYAVSIDAGGNAAGNQRQLNGAGGDIPYGIFTDAARTSVWGDGSTFGNTVSGTLASGSTTTTLTAYGRIPSSAGTFSAGTYTDTVTVTVAF